MGLAPSGDSILRVRFGIICKNACSRLGASAGRGALCELISLSCMVSAVVRCSTVSSTDQQSGAGFTWLCSSDMPAKLFRNTSRVSCKALSRNGLSMTNDVAGLGCALMLSVPPPREAQESFPPVQTGTACHRDGLQTRCATYRQWTWWEWLRHHQEGRRSGRACFAPDT